MTVQVAQLIGAGLACMGLIGAGIGVGTIFGNYLSGALRNPSAADGRAFVPVSYTHLDVYKRQR